jgi:two-component system response regulator LytT
LNTALNKCLSSNSSPTVQPDILKQLLTSFQTSKKRNGILVKSCGGFTQIKVSDFLYFYSEESITFGVITNNRYIIEETIDQLFDSISPEEFYRINRGQIVSKSAISKFEPYFNHRVKLTVTNPRDQEFTVSRPKTSEFKAWMNS